MTTKANTERMKGLAHLREPFPAHLISKLPKGTKAQNTCQAGEKTNCKICGGWHHPKIVHLDYVGHAALTDRLLDTDPLWHWEPLAFTDGGLPAFDDTGGLWIRLHVCGHSRIGYGHAVAASFKEIGSREKEVIGDALRNAAMRFGAALDLWHKGDLHHASGDPQVEDKPADKKLWRGPLKTTELKKQATVFNDSLKQVATTGDLEVLLAAYDEMLTQLEVDLPQWYAWEDEGKGAKYAIDAKYDEIQAKEA